MTRDRFPLAPPRGFPPRSSADRDEADGLPSPSSFASFFVEEVELYDFPVDRQGASQSITQVLWVEAVTVPVPFLIWQALVNQSFNILVENVASLPNMAGLPSHLCPS